ncbi:MAG: crossover junction endodeoxyribonuclease RuvC [Phycisphaerae bacterium]|jgi:crossover junction endodeoxyribonuclease RuvC|nr:crossover junction endodeoxyribonuclease RuvC [Phycisphaerae bacterium]
MTKAQRYRVLGIDPGLNITGYGIVDFAGSASQPAIIEGGAIRTDAKADIARRIEQIHADLTALLAEFRPDLVAIENLYAHYAHPRTSILMAHARGVVLLAAQQTGVAVRGLAATKVKKSLTGNGHASKLQVQRAIQAVCRLEALPEPPDVADALAIALCAGRQR